MPVRTRRPATLAPVTGGKRQLAPDTRGEHGGRWSVGRRAGAVRDYRPHRARARYVGCRGRSFSAIRRTRSPIACIYSLPVLVGLPALPALPCLLSGSSLRVTD